jgi:deoxyribodipyrimidine photolyase-related protein
LATRFAKYGPYQDAIVDDNVFMYHSVISASLNIGLLTVQYVIQEAVNTPNIPFNSVEGFIRQVIGWREYMRYIYVYYAPEITHANLPDNNRTFRQMAPWYKGTTGVYPLDQEIKKAVKYAYAHHIIRLMVFMNFFILCEIHPAIIYKWFMEVVSIDAYEWVMVSNIYAMGYFDKGAMRKPYITTSNYILKMSNYKAAHAETRSNAKALPSKSWAQLWDSLFYRFVANKSPTYVAFYKRLLKRFTTEQLNAQKQQAQHFIDSYTKPVHSIKK